MACKCEHRGFRHRALAEHVYHEMTKRLGLTEAHDFYQCEQGAWHWETRFREIV